MRFIRRAATVSVATVSVLAVSTGAALAHQCVNPDKQAGAGAQILIDFTDGGITFLTAGMEKRFASGVTTEDTFRGLIGLDFDGDGDADMTTWIVGRYGEIPQQAQAAGAECHGVISVDAYFGCLEAAIGG